MSGKEIQMSPQEIADRAQRIRNRTAEIDGFLDQVEKKIREVNNAWEGKASDAYVQQFMKIKAVIKEKLQESLDSLSKAMTDIASKIEQADQTLANQVSNIDA